MNIKDCKVTKSVPDKKWVGNVRKGRNLMVKYTDER